MKTVSVVVLAIAVSGLGVRAFGGEPSQTEQRRIAVQQICPVSGNKLGDHGTPVKITVGKEKETVYLCCRGCLKGKIDMKHWATIHASIAKAQGKCPVMEKPLPKKPKWTVVKGQVIYICCPPCTKKIAADPKKFLKKVDAYYVSSLRAKNSSVSAGTTKVRR